MLTLGTGIGSAIFVDGTLVPNTEFGHIKIRGKDTAHGDPADSGSLAVF
jgi:polyphosphate glucokinase